MNSSMSYFNKEVYVGIDVHKASYSITAVCDKKVVKSATVKANPDALARSLVNWFADAKKVHSVYESGFSGYVLHRKLENAGVRNIVVNPASIAIASNDKVKTDLRDSKKLAVELSDQRLRAIYIPSVDEELDRLLPRTREQIVEHRATIARQIKMKLHQFGLISPDENKIISNRYIKAIESKALDPRLKQSLGFLFSQWRFATQKLIEIRALFKEQAAKSSKIERIYRSIPGVGEITARVLATELGDMSRFKNERAIASYTGLTPSEYSSGEHTRKGSITRQGSSRIRHMLVEVTWRAVTKNPEFKKQFDGIAHRRGKKKAVVAMARRMIIKMRACLRDGVEYGQMPARDKMQNAMNPPPAIISPVMAPPSRPVRPAGVLRLGTPSLKGALPRSKNTGLNRRTAPDGEI